MSVPAERRSCLARHIKSHQNSPAQAWHRTASAALPPCLCASTSDTGLCLGQLNKQGMEPDQFGTWQPKFQRKQKEFSKVSHMIMICMKRQVGPPLSLAQLACIVFG